MSEFQDHVTAVRNAVRDHHNYQKIKTVIDSIPYDSLISTDALPDVLNEAFYNSIFSEVELFDFLFFYYNTVMMECGYQGVNMLCEKMGEAFTVFSSSMIPEQARLKEYFDCSTLDPVVKVSLLIKFI
jgi:hypothetical protein